MTHDLPEELRRAAGPLPELDEATFDRLNRPRRRSGHVVLVMAIAVLVAATAGSLVARTGSDVQLAPGNTSTEAAPSEAAPSEAAPSTEPSTSTEDADPTAAADPADVAGGLGGVDWEVLAVGITPHRSWVGHVATDQAGLDSLWQTFEMDGSAPVLPPGQGALVLPVAGSCDNAAQVRGIEGIVNADTTGAFAAVHIDASCVEELPGSGTVPPPPRTLYVIAVPVEAAQHLAGVVAVVGGVADLDWEVLAVGATPDPLLLSGHVVSDQEGIDILWRQFRMQGSAPALPAGQGALVLAVSGSCDNGAQVRAVKAVAAGEVGTASEVLGAVYFDASCAEPLRPGTTDPRPRTLYVIAVPLEVAESVGGSLAFIACDEAHGADSTQCADPTDNAIPADEPIPGS